MMSFKQFVEENAIAANAMGTGSGIAKVDPLLFKKPFNRKKPKK